MLLIANGCSDIFTDQHVYRGCGKGTPNGWVVQWAKHGNEEQVKASGRVVGKSCDIIPA